MHGRQRRCRQRRFYLAGNGALSYTAPTERNASDSYVSDPMKPVPYTNAYSFGYYQLYPLEDQRFASRRPDVLVYETEPLADDLTLAGPIGVDLKIATTGTDADFIVKVIDVYPDTPLAGRGSATSMDGYQQLVKGDVYRARWRRSLSKPEALVPGKADSVNYVLHDVFHTFKKGHRPDGARAEHAGIRSSTAIRRSSCRTSTRRTRATSRRRR